MNRSDFPGLRAGAHLRIWRESMDVLKASLELGGLGLEGYGAAQAHRSVDPGLVDAIARHDREVNARNAVVAPDAAPAAPGTMHPADAATAADGAGCVPVGALAGPAGGGHGGGHGGDEPDVGLRARRRLAGGERRP